MDLNQHEGRYPLPPQAGPILGVEFAGIVEQMSSHCARPIYVELTKSW